MAEVQAVKGLGTVKLISYLLKRAYGRRPAVVGGGVTDFRLTAYQV
jgi:hypothetical protein